MNSPQLNGYPFDQQVVRQIRAREHARELARLARRRALPPASGLQRFRQLIRLWPRSGGPAALVVSEGEDLRNAARRRSCA